MPIVQITTNVSKLGTPFMKSIAALVAEMTQKPEKGVVVMLSPEHQILYNDSLAPLAHIRFTSLDMSVSDHAKYSTKFADHFNNKLNIDKERVVIEFHSPSAAHLGKDGTTIAELRKLPK